jgi:uridylate kinase
MRYRFNRTIIVTLGGSIVYPAFIRGKDEHVRPGEIDTAFLRRFDRFLRRHVREGKRFVLVVGGGQLARRFQEAAARIRGITNDDKDWLGIHATRLNAHLVRTMFRDIADPVVIDERGRVKRLRRSVTVAAGWRPGWSTDYIAAVLAYDFGAQEVIVAGKPAYVYDKDHATHTNAKPLRELSWKAYRNLIPKKWSPGLHAPMDPIAAKFAEEKGLAAIVVDGRELKNLDALLNGKEFKGTIVR